MYCMYSEQFEVQQPTPGHLDYEELVSFHAEDSSRIRGDRSEQV